jgi:hypothetical protein
MQNLENDSQFEDLKTEKAYRDELKTAADRPFAAMSGVTAK